MKASCILFGILFVLTFLMHKPFHIHTAQKRWIQEIHHYCEFALVMQGLIVLNLLFW